MLEPALDDAIANIALPSIQLAVPDSVLPWVINPCVLAFGSLLLFGGGLGDLFGRRRILRIGLVLFSVASLMGGFGVNAGNADRLARLACSQLPTRLALRKCPSELHATFRTIRFVVWTRPA